MSKWTFDLVQSGWTRCFIWRFVFVFVFECKAFSDSNINSYCFILLTLYLCFSSDLKPLTYLNVNDLTGHYKLVYLFHVLLSPSYFQSIESTVADLVVVVIIAPTCAVPNECELCRAVLWIRGIWYFNAPLFVGLLISCDMNAFCRSGTLIRSFFLSKLIDTVSLKWCLIILYLCTLYWTYFIYYLLSFA